MSNQEQEPVVVTGEERAHPAVRLLARACIALAQEQLAAEKRDEKPEQVTTGTTNTRPTDDVVEGIAEAVATMSVTTTANNESTENVDAVAINVATLTPKRGRTSKPKQIAPLSSEVESDV